MKWLTANAAARRLRRHPDLVRRWLREGRLRGERFGNAWMISQRELERFKRNGPERRLRRN